MYPICALFNKLLLYGCCNILVASSFDGSIECNDVETLDFKTEEANYLWHSCQTFILHNVVLWSKNCCSCLNWLFVQCRIDMKVLKVGVKYPTANKIICAFYQFHILFY